MALIIKIKSFFIKLKLVINNHSFYIARIKRGRSNREPPSNTGHWAIAANGSQLDGLASNEGLVPFTGAPDTPLGTDTGDVTPPTRSGKHFINCSFTSAGAYSTEGIFLRLSQDIFASFSESDG